MKQVIILLPIEDYDRRDDAESVENTTFESLGQIGDRFEHNGVMFFTSMSDFMDSCNDQEINLEHFWLTYVNVRS
jgi:hypothetical protein